MRKHANLVARAKKLDVDLGCLVPLREKVVKELNDLLRMMTTITTLVCQSVDVMRHRWPSDVPFPVPENAWPISKSYDWAFSLTVDSKSQKVIFVQILPPRSSR